MQKSQIFSTKYFKEIASRQFLVMPTSPFSSPEKLFNRKGLRSNDKLQLLR